MVVAVAVACGSFGAAKDDPPPLTEEKEGGLVIADASSVPSEDGATAPDEVDDAGLLEPDGSDAAVCVPANSPCGPAPCCANDLRCREGMCRVCSERNKPCNNSTIGKIVCCDEALKCMNFTCQ